MNLKLFSLRKKAAFLLIFSLSFESFCLAQNSNNMLTDRVVAQKHCSSCHVFPEPALLDKKTWVNSVLPNMGWRLGIRKTGENPYKEMDEGESNLVKSLNVFPEKRQISDTDWKKIVAYYEKNAPETPFPQKNKPHIDAETTLFSAFELKISDQKVPNISLVKYNPADKNLYIGNAGNELYQMNKDFQISNIWKTESPPVDIVFPENQLPKILTIGEFSPSEKKKGKFVSLDSSLFKSTMRYLKRPVSASLSDINQDGQADLILSEFGNHTGFLSWYDSGLSSKKNILRAQPGARKVEVADINKDGKPDIIALFAQGKEEVVIFYNQGNGMFEEKTILQFPPVYGLSHFELKDFNWMVF